MFSGFAFSFRLTSVPDTVWMHSWTQDILGSDASCFGYWDGHACHGPGCYSKRSHFRSFLGNAGETKFRSYL